MTPLLQVENLHLSIGEKELVHDLSFSIFPGEVLGIVGESGSGKSVTAHAIMGLFLGKSKGKIDFGGTPGKDMTLVLQNPMTSLNPTQTIRKQISEAANYHQISFDPEKLLQELNILKSHQCLSKYPHELSGGQRQRILLAMALSTKPKLLIADEPTTALDVTTQKQLLELLKEQQRKRNMAIIFLSHDLGVIAHICDRVAVMLDGRIVENAPIKDLLNDPQHPYTKSLLELAP